MQGILVSAALILPLLHPADLSEAFARHRIFVPVTFGDTHVRPNQDIMQHGGALHLAPIVVNNRFTFPRGQNHAIAETETSVNKLIASPDWGMYLLAPDDVERQIVHLHQFRKLHYEVAGSLAQLTLPCRSAAEFAQAMAA